MEINPRDRKFRVVFELAPVLSRSKLLCFDRFLANTSFASCMYILHKCAFLAKQVHNQTVTRQNHKPKLPRLAVKHKVKLYIHWNSVEGLLKIGEFSLLEPIWNLACGWLLILKISLDWAKLTFFFLSWYKRKARFNLVLIWRSRWHGSVEDMCLPA